VHYLRIVVSGNGLFGLVGMAQRRRTRRPTRKRGADAGQGCGQKQKDIIAMVRSFRADRRTGPRGHPQELNLDRPKASGLRVIGDSLAELPAQGGRSPSRDQ